MDFVSLGMFILDDIYYPIPRAPVTGIIGGAGSYAVLGARIMQGSGHGIGWTVHVGSDFPEHVRKEIESWETGCQFIDTPGRLTTRGLNTYRQQERRGKKRPKKLLRSRLYTGGWNTSLTDISMTSA